MTAERTTNAEAAVVTWTFDAPVDLVWRAWSEPEHFMKWWGPKGFTAPAAEMDLRVGGKYLFCMRTPEGQDLWSTGTYLEIEPLRRIAYTDSFADEHGNVVSSTHYGMPDMGTLEFKVTVTFEEQGSQTLLTLRHEGLPAGDMREQAAEGWRESLEKLAESLR